MDPEAGRCACAGNCDDLQFCVVGSTFRSGLANCSRANRNPTSGCYIAYGRVRETTGMQYTDSADPRAIAELEAALTLPLPEAARKVLEKQLHQLKNQVAVTSRSSQV